MRLTKNFTKEEFDSKDGSEMPDDVLPNIQKLANQLQYVRDYLEQPIKVNSGYRSLTHNTAIGGSQNSQHLIGRAADIRVKNISSKTLYDLIEDLIDKGEILQGGLGLYNTFVHYDIRKSKVRWDYRK
jgi:uncharacterized protein YcbK (DUF882 family)